MQLEFPSQPRPSGTPGGAARSGPAQHDSTRGLFWYPRLGWETSLFPLLTAGKSDVSQPNRRYQNRPPSQHLAGEEFVQPTRHQTPQIEAQLYSETFIDHLSKNESISHINQSIQFAERESILVNYIDCVNLKSS
ncbi:hypothetical protein AVEN_210054-1 [Araneus ventricosus]|uniref:Uncharacterized protein n=1 Tax=Araneus ventricosus TaxID=182803 RepID=A0A4Y2JRS1_ARAVE|nr:hypothetical protein AVEN_210054-1 [Araneus ventricosus]